MEQYKLFDNIFEPLVVIDKDRKIVYYNHYFTTFSKSPPRVLKKVECLSELFNSESFDLQAFVKKAIDSKAPSLSEEVQIELSQDQDISYIVVIKSFPIEGDDQHTSIVFNDLSIEKRLYDKYRTQLEEIKNNHNQIVQADKLSTIGELTAGISHEISNPLTIASGNCEIIETLLESDDLNSTRDMLSKALGDIQSTHERILAIISNMKSFLYKSEDVKEYENIKDVIDVSSGLVAPSYKSSRVNLQVNTENPDIIGLINRTKIEQVIVNLLKNSLDALKEARVETPEVQINLYKNKEDDNIIIDIVDNGPGIPEDIQEGIFETFFTTKKIGEGTGLGLAISQKIMEEHYGSLSYVDEAQKGAIFRISIPSVEISSFTQNEIKHINFNSEDLTGERVLVVDNEVQVLNVLSKFLEASGYVFIGSASPEDALNIIDDIDVDLIITDYRMPQMTGTEFAEKVRENNSRIPILYMSSQDNIEHYQKDKDKLKLGGVIIKPFTQESVAKTIQLTLKGE